MPVTSLSSDDVLALLKTAPHRIAGVSVGLSPEQLQTAPVPGEWSLAEVLAHLRACSEVWGGCMVSILTQDHPSLRAISPRTWIKKTDYARQPFSPAFDDYIQKRADLLAVLSPLPPELWLRTAAVKTVGKVYDKTLLLYAQNLAGHEQEHLRQMERIASVIRS